MADGMSHLAAALADRYRIERELGAGGMATVYLAEDLKHGRPVAIKVLSPELSAILGRDRFLQEIQLTARLHHPHILPLHDSGAADGLLYYVMPFVAGESLRQKLNRERQLSVADAIAITVQVATALDYAHGQGLVHRDIKPENILLEAGQAVVADFGIALAVRTAGGARLTGTGLSLGTPQYMSPEQAAGDRELDARSDVYSLACVTYEMLAGSPPHAAPTVQALVTKVMTETPRPLAEVRRTVSPNVSAAVDQALAKLPADRFASAAGFAAALENRLGAAAASHRAPLFSRRVSMAAIGISSVALLAVGGLAGRAWSTRNLRPLEFDGELIGGSTIAFNPRVSPDGQMVAFNAMVAGQAQLAVLTPGTGHWLQLTHDRSRGPVADFSWSADGKKLFFDRDPGWARDVYSVSALGGDERLVLENAASPEALPDGSVLVRRLNSGLQWQIFRCWPEDGRMDTLPALGGQGFIGTFFRAFRDGSAVAFYGRASFDTLAKNHLHVVDLESKQARRIAPGLTVTPPFWRFSLAVSADGREVLFDQVSRDLHRIIAVASDGAKRRRTLLTLTSGPLGLDVGPDGSLYVDQGSQPSELIWFTPSGRTSERWPIPASESPVLVLSDGRALTTVHSGGWRVIVVGRGLEPKPLLDTPLASDFPLAQVGPDRVALILGTAPNRKVALASMTSGRIIGHVNGVDGESVRGLAATPDGKTLFYVQDRVVWAIPTGGGEPRRVRTGDDVAVDPAGGYLVIKTNETDGIRLFHVPWPQGDEREIRIKPGPFRPAHYELSPNAVSADGRILLRVGTPASWYYPMAILDQRTGELSVVEQSSQDMVSGGWGADGRPVTKANNTNARLWRFRPLAH